MYRVSSFFVTTTAYTEKASAEKATSSAASPGSASSTSSALPASSMWTTTVSSSRSSSRTVITTEMGISGSISFPSMSRKVMSTAWTRWTSVKSSCAAASPMSDSMPSSSTSARRMVVPSGNAPSSASTVTVT